VSGLLIAGMVVLVLLNGFFVAAEFALVRVSRGRIAELAEQEAGAAVVLRELEDLSTYLAACQFGITLASLGIGFLGEPAFARLLEPPLGDLMSHGLAAVLALSFAYLVSTAAHITVGEQVPKILAIADAERMARRIARPLWVFTRVFAPAIAVLNRASNGILRMLGVRGDALDEDAATPEEIRRLIGESVAGGGIERLEAEMLAGVFELGELTAREVMTPFPAIVGVDAETTAEDALDAFIDSGHTRMPVARRDARDHVVGVVHVNEVLRAARRGSPQTRLEQLAGTPLIVPETLPLETLLTDMQAQRASLAVVADEYGRTVGIVTVEDIIEEIVGEIADETDPAVADIRRLPDGELFVRGHVPLADLDDYDFEVRGESDAFVSIGGLITSRLGRLPRAGEEIDVDGWKVRVVAVRENRVEAVRIRRAPAS
jgi:magnesium and cobalt exporter, CNNM family